MKKAKIKCPHCGKPITVRQVDRVPIDVQKIWDRSEELFKAMDTHLRRVFDPKLWRK